MTKGTAFNLATLLFVVISLSIVVGGARDRQKQIDFLCTTSGSLGQVLSDAAAQIQANFDDGTYRRLLVRGIVTKKNITQAHKTHDSYISQVKALHSPASPCAPVVERTHGKVKLNP